MGKASNLKKLRRLAVQLPAINVRQKQSLLMTGEELISKGLRILGKGTEKEEIVKDDKMYKSTQLVEVPLNHNRKLKQAYKKYGMAGAAQYANSVINYAAKK